MEEGGRLLIEMTCWGDILDEWSIKCRTCGAIVKLSSKIPYEAQNWIFHIRNCKELWVSLILCCSTVSSLSSEVLVDSHESMRGEALLHATSLKSMPLHDQHMCGKDVQWTSPAPCSDLLSSSQVSYNSLLRKQQLILSFQEWWYYFECASCNC